jgi:hypothetical protein
MLIFCLSVVLAFAVIIANHLFAYRRANTEACSGSLREEKERNAA